jgi:hypothetical protein
MSSRLTKSSRLKDSDVTWLYGPYHTAIDWAPPPKPKPDPGGVDKERAPGESLDLVTPAKQLRSPSLGRATTRPILKHRSVSELLAIPLPPSPPVEDDDDDEDDGGLTGAASALLDFPNRPSLLHTKSDSHIVRWRRAQAYRTDSPAVPEPVADEPPSGSNSDRDSAEAGVASAAPQRRKHISFNTFVEQCIAIDTHSESEAKQRTASMNGRGARLYAAAPHYSRLVRPINRTTSWFSPSAVDSTKTTMCSRKRRRRARPRPTWRTMRMKTTRTTCSRSAHAPGTTR